MAYSFYPEKVFSKGIVNAEFFDASSGDLLGFTNYVTDFGVNGSMNNGEVEGGPGNMLVMMIPDSARLAVTAKSADSALNNMALTVGGTVTGNGIIETVGSVSATGTTLTIANAAAAPGANKKYCYVLSSSGADDATVKADSGTAHEIDENGVIQNFTSASGNTYCVKYFVANSSAKMLTIPALFSPKIVRAHFAVNLYAKPEGADAMASSLYAIRHYYFPYYFFTGAMTDAVGQTSTGTVDLSGNCMTYEEASVSCDALGAQTYGWIVDEYVGNGNSTYNVEGIYFVGLGSGATVASGQTVTLPAKYEVAGALTQISDPSVVTYSTAAESTAKFSDPHVNVLTGVAAGSTTATVTVTNARTGVTYTDTIPVTVA